MKTSLYFVVTVSCLLLFLPATRAQESGRALQGSWAGTLKVQGVELHLVMNVSVNAADSMTVTFDSPDQGAKGIPTSKVALRGDSLIVSSKAIGGKFSAKRATGDTTLPGTWKQGGLSLPLTLVRQAKPFTLNRPQEPKPPFPYRTEEVRFSNPAGGFELAGTLTIPEKEGRYPVAILVTGSGPQNRDEELLGHKPFLVLSDYLTRQGIAVLRYDDRGVGKSGGVFRTATTPDFATDAEAAIAFLKKHPGIDSSKIGIIGHSEGGIIAPVVASHRHDVAFVVLMAGPGLPGEQILYLQSALIAKAEKADDKTIKANERISRDIYSVIKKTGDDSTAAKRIRKIFADADKKNEKDTSYHKQSPEAVDAQIKQLTSPWFRCFLVLAPADYLSKVTCPLLAINGSLDLQVPPKENLQAIEKALIFGGNSSYTIEELPGLNHLFQEAVTGSPVEYGKIEQTIAPAALQVIAGWIKNNL
jgi:fermentation-respiration switch protein FrsA (DUF1100 family)